MPSGSTGRVSAYVVWWICVEVAWWCCARLRRVRTLERSVWTSSCTGTRNRVLWRFLWWSGVVISLAAVLLRSPDACCLSFCPAPGTCLWCEHLVRSAIRLSRGDPCRRLMATLGKRECLYSLFADAIVNTIMFFDVSMPNCGHVTNRVHALQSHGADGECSGMTDLLHHALQGRAMSCPMTSLTEFCRCPTDFWHHAIPWRHTVTSWTELCRWPTELWDHAIPWRHWPSYAGAWPIFDITPYHDVITWRHWPNCAGVRPIFWNRSKPTELHRLVTPLIWYRVNDGDWIV